MNSFPCRSFLYPNNSNGSHEPPPPSPSSSTLKRRLNKVFVEPFRKGHNPSSSTASNISITAEVESKSCRSLVDLVTDNLKEAADDPLLMSSSISNTESNEGNFPRLNQQQQDLAEEEIDLRVTTASTPLAPPIVDIVCDLFVDIFELRHKNNWLRRQAVLIILQQIFDGTVERKVIDSIDYLLSEEMIIYYLETFKNSYWPNGKLYEPLPSRGEKEKLDTKSSLRRKLDFIVPGKITYLQLRVYL